MYFAVLLLVIITKLVHQSEMEESTFIVLCDIPLKVTLKVSY